MVMNRFHNPSMAIPDGHRTLVGWKNLFRKADIKCVSVVVLRPFRGYPIDNYMFALMVP